MRHSNQLIIDIANVELFCSYLLGSIAITKLEYEKMNRILWNQYCCHVDICVTSYTEVSIVLEAWKLLKEQFF